MSERLSLVEDFIARAGWGDAKRSPIKGDASTRSYQRLLRGADKAVLMNAPKGEEAPGEREGASVAERRALGYNALARLAGPNLEAFLCVAQELTRRGFSAPHILAADTNYGFALLEDFGDADFASVLRADPAQERTLYEAAVDTLAAIYRSTFPRRPDWRGQGWWLRDYDEAALLAETDLFIDYYVPDSGQPVSDTAREEFRAVWRTAFKALGAHASGLALRDFHAENLFWLPERERQAKVGLIDFQDALFAHPAYDLVSLLEDARRDVSDALHAPLKQRFCDAAGLPCDEAFNAAYAVQAAQRNAKILGIFVRLVVRDGKPKYRRLIPRVKAHFQRDLTHPACAGIRAWCETHCPEVLA